MTAGSTKLGTGLNFTKVTYKLTPMNEDGTPGNPASTQYDLATATN